MRGRAGPGCRAGLHIRAAHQSRARLYIRQSSRDARRSSRDARQSTTVGLYAFSDTQFNRVDSLIDKIDRIEALKQVQNEKIAAAQ